MDQTPLTRRAVVAGGCGLAAAAALTACSGYGAGGPVTASAPSAAPNEAAGTAGGNAGEPPARWRRSPTSPSAAGSSSPPRTWS